VNLTSLLCSRLVVALLGLADTCAHAGAPAPVNPPALQGVPELQWTVAERQPHDPTLFTQGIAFHDDVLLESGGGYRESRVVMHRPGETRALRTAELPRSWFGEGLAALDDRVFVLTWREGVAQSFRLPALESGARFSYEGEGWGLASDGRSLIQSDGSNVLTWRDPRDFSVTAKIAVHAGDEPVQMLNELEWVHGWILANVWLSDYIVGIDPASGCVHWKLSLAGLLDAGERRRADVLNGIAWDERNEQLWVTGKLWPWLFRLRVQLPPAPGASALTAGRCPG